MLVEEVIGRSAETEGTIGADVYRCLQITRHQISEHSKDIVYEANPDRMLTSKLHS